jgi:excisionase family DNA binding protein
MSVLITDQITTMKLDRLLKPDEVAQYLNISRSFAYKLIETGEIVTVRLGRARRVRIQDLVDYIERNRHNLTDAA